MPVLLQIAIGGAIGASLRHLLGLQVGRLGGTAVPWGTLAVNLLGSLAMGLLAALLLPRGPAPHPMAPFLMTGLLGGFTTFSAFAFDVFMLVERGRAGFALAYVAASVMLGLAAFVIGYAAVRAWPW